MKLKIKPKFNLCDTVWLLSDNRIRAGVIRKISIDAEYYQLDEKGEKSGISYTYFYELDGYKYMSEHNLFGSKQELLDFINKESEKE